MWLLPPHVWFSREMEKVSYSPSHLLQQNSAGSWDVLGGSGVLAAAHVPSISFQRDLFNHNTQQEMGERTHLFSLTGAEMMPRVKGNPGRGNGNPRLQAPHPGSKPSPHCWHPGKEPPWTAVPSMEGFHSWAW